MRYIAYRSDTKYSVRRITFGAFYKNKNKKNHKLCQWEMVTCISILTSDFVGTLRHMKNLQVSEIL